MSATPGAGRRAVLAAIFALAAVLRAAPAAAEKAIFVVRHAEKASDSSDANVPLSEAGRRRAERLAAMLGSAGITAIYSTDTVRTRATAEPLAHALHLETRIYDAKGPAGDAALIERLRSEPNAVALVVGHSNSVPRLLAALGVSETVEIGDGDYDNLFLVVPQGARPPVFLRLKD